MMVFEHDGAYDTDYMPEKCEICGETMKPTDEKAEMYDPNAPAPVDSVICHAQCGLWKGYELA